MRETGYVDKYRTKILEGDRVIWCDSEYRIVFNTFENEWILKDDRPGYDCPSLDGISSPLMSRIWVIAREGETGYGRCYQCHRNWKLCRAHSTDFNRESGCFPLCQECWQELDVEGRLVYYRQLWQDWNREDTYPLEEWTQIEAAVRQGK
jgi:hypothetical protein